MRTVPTAAGPLLMIIDHTSAASNARELVPTSRRHCVCREHGPRGGCLCWTCSDNTSEIVTRMLRHDCVDRRICCVGIGCAQLAADPPPAKLPATVFVLLINPTSPLAEIAKRDSEAAALKLGLQLHVLYASADAELDEAFAAFREMHAGALVIGTDAFFN